MTEVHQLTRDDARRIAVTAQLAAAARPGDLLELVRKLAFLQSEPTSAVAPSAEVVAWSRIGPSHQLGDVDHALDIGTLVELRSMIRPAEDIALYRAEMAAWPGAGELPDYVAARRDWVIANDHTRRDILEKLYDEGPLTSRELPDTTVVPWESSGWNNDRNIRMLLEQMVLRGEVAIAGREGRDRLWDLAERVYPDDPVVPLTDALRIRDERRLRALGIARPRAPKSFLELDDVGDFGEPAVIEGVRGTWRVDPAQIDPSSRDVPFTGRTVLLSPLDRIVFDRKRMVDLFEFDYQLEMYKPAAKRRWGYWAMPILHGDRLVGKLDATADRDRGLLRVDAVHEDGEWDDTMREAVHSEIRALAAWLGLQPEMMEG